MAESEKICKSHNFSSVDAVAADFSYYYHLHTFSTYQTKDFTNFLSYFRKYPSPLLFKQNFNFNFLAIQKKLYRKKEIDITPSNIPLSLLTAVNYMAGFELNEDQLYQSLLYKEKIRYYTQLDFEKAQKSLKILHGNCIMIKV